MIDVQSETWLEIAKIAEAERAAAIKQLITPGLSETQSSLCRGRIAAYSRILDAPDNDVIKPLVFDDYN